MTTAATMKPDGTFVLYHGTHRDLPVGTILVPSASGEVEGNWGYGEGNTKNQSVWMTDEIVRAKTWAEDGAWAYARDRKGMSRDEAWRYKDQIHIYEVEPIGPVTEHPEGTWMDYAAPQARIVRKVSTTKTAASVYDLAKIRSTHTIDGVTYTVVGREDGPWNSGLFVDARIGGVPVGHINIGYVGYEGEDHLSIQWVEVDPEHRRRGIASNMLRLARESTDFRIIHDTTLSPEGRAWSEVVGSKTASGNTIYRGFKVELPDDLMAKILDLAEPPMTIEEKGKERQIGRLVVDWLMGNEWQGSTRAWNEGLSLGRHWTTDKEMARKYASLRTASIDADQIREHLLDVDLPNPARDGDCIWVSGAVTKALKEHGWDAAVEHVTGWDYLMGTKVIVFAHMVARVGDTIIDASATQYDTSLPPIWITDADEYREALAKATHVMEVTFGY